MATRGLEGRSALWRRGVCDATAGVGASLVSAVRTSTERKKIENAWSQNSGPEGKFLIELDSPGGQKKGEGEVTDPESAGFTFRVHNGPRDHDPSFSFTDYTRAYHNSEF